ncbi:MAG: hypothetical protein JWP35_3550 [Caulobacter sp.]|nr:hypothetical protein [Caulobacter sp.]
MTDIALTWSDVTAAAEMVLTGGDLATDDGLQTAVIISLFSDARAAEDDDLPHADADRRGWWGDTYADVEGDSIGSRLWLLSRGKQLPGTLTEAKTYAQEALAWLIEDGVAASIDIEASYPAPGFWALGIGISRPHGPARNRFDFVWEATA